MKRTLFSILLVVALLAASIPIAGASPLAAGPSNKLSKHDRELLAEAGARGDATVTLLIASKPPAETPRGCLRHGSGQESPWLVKRLPTLLNARSAWAR